MSSSLVNCTDEATPLVEYNKVVLESGNETLQVTQCLKLLPKSGTWQFDSRFIGQVSHMIKPDVNEVGTV